HLTEDYWCYWPQSSELIRGRANFAGVNTNYPAHGLWQFDVKRLVADGASVVTEVHITDSVLKAIAISFHSVRDGLIASQTEYWPDPTEPPFDRSQWVEHATSAPE
ncbi:MAG: nuclear transport factor 2 family protein, partial [Pseudomonadota bacterium]